MEPLRLPGPRRGGPVVWIVAAAAAVTVVMWPRLAPPAPVIPDERPVAIPTAAYTPPQGDTAGRGAPTPRTVPRDDAARAAAAPGPELELAADPPSARRRRRTGRPQGRGRARRGGRRTAAQPLTNMPGAAPLAPAVRVAPRAPGRRTDAEILP